ncbi:MAG: shikimate dehydrogenase [Sulfurospirillum sp.]|nr:shikimate dehydrogenase [Sulfurospirillum sp.]
MKLFSIFGNPVSHSISPKMHNQVIRDFNLKACYIRTCIQDPKTLMQTFHQLKLDGANVTVPHKEVALAQCDKLDSFAQMLGAVNTLVKKNNTIIGYNTDAPGFYKAITSFGKIKNALILGAGGTARAIAMVLRENNIQVTLLNRSAKRLEFFIVNGFEAYDWQNFQASSYDLIINTTSAGLSDEKLPLEQNLLANLMKNAHFAFDVIYNKQTPFLKLAQQNALTCKDGSDMLLHQGILAFNLFFDNRFNLAEIERSMQKVFLL